jgi:hypothetical protein
MAPCNAHAEELSGRRVMEIQKEKHEVKSDRSTVVMLLIDKKGHKKKRLLERWGKRFKNGLRRGIIVFKEPKDISGIRGYAYIFDNISLYSSLKGLSIVTFEYPKLGHYLYPGKKIKAAVNESIGFQEKTDVKLRITKPMSMHRTMIELVHNRVTSALSENSVSMPTDAVDVLIIGHGSKDPNAKRSMKYVVEGIDPTYRNVSSCFLEIEEPNIEQGIAKCKNDNPEVLVVVFYFLHEGAHVKRDIYEDLNPALEKANLPKVLITKHIGTDEKMIDLVLERAKEVEDAN